MKLSLIICISLVLFGCGDKTNTTTTGDSISYTTNDIQTTTNTGNTTDIQTNTNSNNTIFQNTTSATLADRTTINNTIIFKNSSSGTSRGII